MFTHRRHCFFYNIYSYFVYLITLLFHSSKCFVLFFEVVYCCVIDNFENNIRNEI